MDDLCIDSAHPTFVIIDVKILVNAIAVLLSLKCFPLVDKAIDILDSPFF